MQKIDKIIYWGSTGLLCILMLLSATMYMTKTGEVEGFFKDLGYPAYLVFPLAIAKLLGVIAILTKQVKFLKEWAYAGFFFDMVLAASAHLAVDDGGHITAIVGLALLTVSYIYDKKLFTSKHA